MANIKEIPIPINLGLNKAIDEVGLKGYAAALQDCYVDEEGNVHRRPGLEDLCDLGTGAGIDGLFWWQEEEKAIAVSDGETYEITANDGTAAEIEGDAFEVGTRVIFGNYGTDLYAANGGKIIQIPSSGDVAALSDVDAPTEVTHPQVMDTFLMGNEVDSGRLHYSTVLAPTTWPGNYVTAEQKADTILAVIAENASIWLMGGRSLEPWANDGSTPFVKEIQGYIKSGTVAAYSFCMCGDVLYWLDNERNIVRLAPGSRSPQVISTTMNAYIQGFTTVNDAKGDYVVVGGRAYYVLTFQSEEKTLVWDLIGNRWYEWGYWHTASATYKNWLGNCHCLAESWNMALVGDRSTGKIYKLDPTAYDDAGDTMRTLVRTADFNYGTSSVRKISHALIIEAERTNVVNEAAVTTMTLRYRDNGSSTWKNERTITLGQVGDTGYIGTLRRNGSFYSRQYEFMLSDDTSLCLKSVKDIAEFCYI